MQQPEPIATLRHAAGEASGSSTVGWAESPLQLLAIVEAHAAGILGPETVAVPREGAAWLGATAEALQEMRLPDGLLIPKSKPTIPAPSDALAVGDAFSGVVQSSLLLRRDNRIVIVDDGLATVDLLSLLVLGQPLTRARGRPRLAQKAARWALGRVALEVLRRAARRGRLEVFTAMAIPAELQSQLSKLGVRLHRHGFSWLRSQPAPPVPDQPTIILGSSLSHDGLVSCHKYLSWLLDEADRGPIAYYPHRREDAAALARLQSHPNVEVEHTELPVELSLRGLNPEQRVVSLPSTAIISLRLMLGDEGAAVHAVDVPGDWWTPNASRQIKQRLSRTVEA